MSKTPAVTNVDRVSEGVVVTFADGATLLYTSELLYGMMRGVTIVEDAGSPAAAGGMVGD